MNTILETRPKEGGGGGGKTTNEIVKDTVNDFLSKMPIDYDIQTVRENILKMGGPPKLTTTTAAGSKPSKGLDVPLNVFLL